MQLKTLGEDKYDILSVLMKKIIVKINPYGLDFTGYVTVTFLNNFFSSQNLNKQAYDLAKALLKRTAQAIEPYITNVSGVLRPQAFCSIIVSFLNS